MSTPSPNLTLAKRPPASSSAKLADFEELRSALKTDLAEILQANLSAYLDEKLGPQVTRLTFAGSRDRLREMELRAEEIKQETIAFLDDAFLRQKSELMDLVTRIELATADAKAQLGALGRVVAEVKPEPKLISVADAWEMARGIQKVKEADWLKQGWRPHLSERAFQNAALRNQKKFREMFGMQIHQIESDSNELEFAFEVLGD